VAPPQRRAGFAHAPLRRPQPAHLRAGETSHTHTASTSGAAAPLHAGGGAVVAADADGLTFTQHMMAGALAGTVEHLAMFPLDTVKTRMQAVPHGGASIAHALNYGTMRAAVDTVLRREGVRGLYRGVDAMALGAGPAHAFYFATYEVRGRAARCARACAPHGSRRELACGARHDRGARAGASRARRILLRCCARRQAVKRVLRADDSGHHPAATAVAGACATVVADAILTPLDTVKQRLQIANSPYTGMMNCATRTLRDEGWQAFFRSCALLPLPPACAAAHACAHARIGCL
jgi:solute carrier family 25 iron transporter 28/37